MKDGSSSTRWPTSSTSTRVTSGSSSAPPFFFRFLAFPPCCSSLETASRNFFWLCDFWDLRTQVYSLYLRTSSGCGRAALFAPFPTSTHSFFQVPDAADRDEWSVFSHWAADDVSGLAYTISECYSLLFSTTSSSVILHTVVHISTISTQLICLPLGRCSPFLTPWRESTTRLLNKNYLTAPKSNLSYLKYFSRSMTARLRILPGLRLCCSCTQDVRVGPQSDPPHRSPCNTLGEQRAG